TGTAAWIYFAMQSSYGLSWIVKDFAFPDSNFHKRITIGAGIASFLTVLGWYWLFGWLLISADAPLRRNAHLPVEKSQAFCPRADVQTQLQIHHGISMNSPSQSQIQGKRR